MNTPLDLQNLTPGQLADERLKLAQESSAMGDKLIAILHRKAGSWMEMRKAHTSDKATDREWEATLDGLEETALRLKMKGNEKVSSAISTKLRTLSDEGRNIY